MKRLLSLLLIFLPLFATAQTAREVLDRTAARLSKGGCSANFEATTFKGHQENGTTNGNIRILNKCYRVETPDMQVWFDGKTQWTMLNGSGEVNVSTPTAEEVAHMNPYVFLNLYKQGYSYTMKPTTYNGKSCYEVDLRAKQSGAEILRLLLIVTKDYTPQNVRLVDRKGNWMRFRLSNVKTGQSFSTSTFQFDKKSHPNIEIIDLR